VYSKLVENQSKAEFWVRVIMSQGSWAYITKYNLFKTVTV
jgi:hypothetical protein